jgi:sulfite reductase beta subunit-like hemoprotein
MGSIMMMLMSAGVGAATLLYNTRVQLYHSMACTACSNCAVAVANSDSLADAQWWQQLGDDCI